MPRHRRVILVAVAALFLTAGCGSTAVSAARTSTSGPSSTIAFHGSAYQWLLDVAEPWNHKLNQDQIAVVQASGTASGVQSSTYFSKLTSSCSTMLSDAHRAGAIAAAPSRALDEGWRIMVQKTVSYASRCLVVARAPTQANLDQWSNSLSDMDGANQLFNEQVATVVSTTTTPVPTQP